MALIRMNLSVLLLTALAAMVIANSEPHIKGAPEPNPESTIGKCSISIIGAGGGGGGLG